MQIDIPSTAGVIAAGATVCGSIYASWRHFRFSKQARKDQEKQDLLKEAKDQVSPMIEALETKINKLVVEIENQKEKVDRDFSYMKSTYTNEIKVLGEKIENLREQINTSHAQMVTLLTQLVNSK